MFAMSTASSKWSDYHLGSMEDFSGLLNTVTVPLIDEGNDGLSFADKSNVTAWGINIYATQLVGTIYLNNILLHKADGTVDTLASFDTAPANIQTAGIASKATYIQANAKGTGPALTAIKPTRVASTSKMLVSVQPGMVIASFSAATAAPAKAVLMNTMGQVIAQQNFTTSKGTNRVELSSDYRGPAMLMVKQGSQKFIQKVILK